MDIDFLNGKDTEAAIDNLLFEYDQLHWAVAWGSFTPLAKKFLSQSSKCKAVTFGLAFAQTDPDLVESLIGLDRCYVVTKFPKGTYHPKVYAFRSRNRVAAIVGSSNFTHGGLSRNHEASVLITGSANDRVLTDLLTFTARSAELGENVTAELATRYRLCYERAKRIPSPPHDPLAELPPALSKSLSSPLVSKNWREYVKAVKSSSHHIIGDSLSILGSAQSWFSSARSFRDIALSERKAIAGFIGDKEKASSTTLNQNWGWFGSMGGAGGFMNRVIENDRFLASAIDSIPQKGEITRQHYDRFTSLFSRAFETSHRSGGVPTASRLLAMKRPDVFLCVSKPNINAAANAMGFSKSTLNLDNYWDRIVETIRGSKWYNVDKPNNEDGYLWEFRAAMLDAIFYNPN